MQPPCSSSGTWRSSRPILFRWPFWQTRSRRSCPGRCTRCWLIRYGVTGRWEPCTATPWCVATATASRCTGWCQAAVRRTLPPPERATVEGTVLRLLQAALPVDILHQPDAWPRWRQLLPHVLVACAERPDPVEPSATSWLLDRAGTYLRSRGEPAAARPLLDRALAITEAAHGPEHPAVATRLNNLAAVLGDLGEPAAARLLLDRALAIHEAAHAPEHPAVATSLGNLAAGLRDLGEPAAAQPLLDRALSIRPTARSTPPCPLFDACSSSSGAR